MAKLEVEIEELAEEMPERSAGKVHTFIPEVEVNIRETLVNQ